MSVGSTLDAVITKVTFKGRRNRRRIEKHSIQPVEVLNVTPESLELKVLSTGEVVTVPVSEAESRLVDMDLGNVKAVTKHLATLYDAGNLVSGDGADAEVVKFCQKLYAFGWDLANVSKFKSAAVSRSTCWNSYDGGGNKELCVRNRMR